MALGLSIISVFEMSKDSVFDPIFVNILCLCAEFVQGSNAKKRICEQILCDRSNERREQ